ncbi:plastid ribosomal protein S16 [Chloropicon primus]|uniref:30S ribosomal protein S16, chloroplastic n=1 Tax=Chloropicon primus TaxID=1764295 RepID=A0A5B8MDS4_9CHLO|nr:plastid ribosomal protein S16 [Chloropicon primus]|mmetsp:Transcript_11785/g.32581  ORF Transcript_11785/g.32581 Transcript_11785/m.32581 type:complete len:138 (-) Transcript_11785:81-494(-)|eukprot:QDZ17500.1 plastid ribosomal protein S16 [Chloropicon primus]
MFGLAQHRGAAACGTTTCRNAGGLAFRANVRGEGLGGARAVCAADVAGAVRVETTSRVKLRFKRMGRKKRPFYRLVAIDSRRKREGIALEELGYYNPLTKETSLNAESIQKWLSQGAEPSDTVASLIKKALPTVPMK